MSCARVQKCSSSHKNLGCHTGHTWLSVYVEQGYDLFTWEIEVIIDELVVMSAILCKDDRVDGHVDC